MISPTAALLPLLLLLPSLTSAAPPAPANLEQPSLLLPASSPFLDLQQDLRSARLRRSIRQSNLFAKARTLQSFADNSPGRNRVFGSKGHNETVNWIYDQLDKKYFDVYFQPFTETYSESSSNVTVDGRKLAAGAFTYGVSGRASTVPVPVANQGCDASDYPAAVEGKLALIQRGVCAFGQKVALAGAAKAAGALIYNNVPGSASGTLGSVERPEGPYVPAAFLSKEDGDALKARVEKGETFEVQLDAYGLREERQTYNVIAQTKRGDPNNVVMAGAHTDSVSAGSGTNDNGSGSIGLLEIAQQLAKGRYALKNAIRFGWWSAEEFGLLGSEYYVDNLSLEERRKLAIYINTDMTASPNFILGAYDGDGSAFNITGPPGSAQLEHLYERYFASQNLPLVPTPFSGRSDYASYIEAGIPAGGLDAGADGIKTEEEVRMFGGVAGVAYDKNYHSAGDTIENLNGTCWETLTKAVAHSLAHLSLSTDVLGPRAEPKAPASGAARIAKENKPKGTHSCGEHQTYAE